MAGGEDGRGASLLGGPVRAPCFLRAAPPAAASARGWAGLGFCESIFSGDARSEGTQLSVQCGSTSVQQLGAIYEVCQTKLEKVTKQ